MTQLPPSSGDALPSGVFEQEQDALAPHTRLDEFELLGVLGVGGFGVVYLALDHALERQVAIKEYMPAMLASRGTGAQLRVRSPRHAETYAKGLASFINEAKLLARFDHPSLLKVYRFWEANGTAYMVMPYYPGRTLTELRLAMPQPPDEAWLRGLVERLLGALEVMHAEGVYHRDVAPDNIVLQADGTPVLLDFGAARRVISEGQLMTAVLKPNFAPIEQYAEVAHLKQGPWTDLYALGGVLYFLLTGKPPTSAAARAIHDELDLPVAVRDTAAQAVSPQFIAAVGWMLAVRPQDRPQSVQALREALGGAAVPEPPPRPAPPRPAAMPRLLVDSPWPPTLPYIGPMRDPSWLDDPEAPPSVEGAAAALPAAVGVTAPGTMPAAGAPDDEPASDGESDAPADPDRPPAAPARPGSRGRWRLGAGAVALGLLGLAFGAWILGGEIQARSSNLDGTALLPQAAVLTSPGQDAPPAQPAAPEAAPAAVADEAVAASALGLAAAAASASEPSDVRSPAHPDGKAPAPKRADTGSRDRTKARGSGTAAKTRVAATPGPRQLCGDRVFASLAACMRRECYKPRYESHPQCVQMRREEERRLLQLVGG